MPLHHICHEGRTPSILTIKIFAQHHADVHIFVKLRLFRFHVILDLIRLPRLSFLHNISAQIVLHTHTPTEHLRRPSHCHVMSHLHPSAHPPAACTCHTFIPRPTLQQPVHDQPVVRVQVALGVHQRAGQVDAHFPPDVLEAVRGGMHELGKDS